MKKLITIISILLIATAALAQTYTPYNDKSSTGYTVERVIDGDTLKLTNGEVVQLIGIKAPPIDIEEAKKEVMVTGQDLETINKMGQEATEFLNMLIVLGSEVNLEFDVQERDKYGRLLAYVYQKVRSWDESPPDFYFDSKGRVFLNAAIVGDGYATPMTIPPNVKYAELFQELYEEARAAKRGLWIQKSEGDSCETNEDCSHVYCSELEKDGLCGKYKTPVAGRLCIKNQCSCAVICP